MNTTDSRFGRKYSPFGLLAALAASATFVLAVTLIIVLVYPNILPELPLTTMFLSSAVGSWCGWSYFFTGRKLHGWIVAMIFLVVGIPTGVVGIASYLEPMQQPLSIFDGPNVLGVILGSVATALGAAVAGDLPLQGRAKGKI